jgi:hypothetical protein
MCGIWGVLSKRNSGLLMKDIQIAKQMMVVTSLRGIDSSGVFMTVMDEGKKTSKIIRTVGDPFHIILSEVGDKFFDMAFKQGQVLVGHGRAATKGNIEIKNAHPFKEKHLTLVHNGTIWTGLEKYEALPDVEVDSHALTHHLVEAGVEEGLRATKGAFAVIVHDSSEECLWIARNHQRPLHYFEDNDCIYIMSTKEALEFVLRSNNVHQYPHIREFEPEKLYCFDLERGALKFTSTINIAPKYEYQAYPFPNTERLPPGTQETSGKGFRTITSVDNKKNKEIEFIVEKIERQSGPYFKYICDSADPLDRTPIVFTMRQYIPTLIDALGTAPIAHVQNIPKRNQKEYVVRVKDIKWENDYDQTKAEESVSGDETSEDKKDVQVVTYGGKTLSRGWLRELLNKHACSVCRETLDIADAEKIMVTESNHLVCPACLNEIKDHKNVDKVDNHMVRNLLQ